MLEQTGKNASCENDSGAESYDSGLPAGLCGYLPVEKRRGQRNCVRDV